MFRVRPEHIVTKPNSAHIHLKARAVSFLLILTRDEGCKVADEGACARIYWIHEFGN